MVIGVTYAAIITPSPFRKKSINLTQIYEIY